MRTPRAWKGPIAEGRLLLISPFDDARRRTTAKLAAERNRLVVDQARALLIVHAAPGGQTEALARRAIAQGKPVLTLVSPAQRTPGGAGRADGRRSQPRERRASPDGRRAWIGWMLLR